MLLLVADAPFQMSFMLHLSACLNFVTKLIYGPAGATTALNCSLCQAGTYSTKAGQWDIRKWIFFSRHHFLYDYRFPHASQCALQNVAYVYAFSCKVVLVHHVYFIHPQIYYIYI
jgi:hypothetical protein